MKTLIPAIFFVIVLHPAHSQELAENTVYVEAGGAGLLGSLNYEHLFKLKNPDQALALRGGVTYINFLDHGYELIYGIPLGVSILLQGKKICFETGASYSAMIVKTWGPPEFPDDYRKSLDNIFALRMGIRKQPLHHGIFWNILIQPTWSYSKYLVKPDNADVIEIDYEYITWLSLGIGYSF